MARFSLTDLDHPIIQAPLAGGPSTPALAAAVCEAGGLGFLGAGYTTPDAVRDDLAALRSATTRPFGLNIFAPPGPPGDPDEVARYVAALEGGGEPRHHDDAFADKVALAIEEGVPLVSFTFGCPERVVFDALHEAGAAAWATVTTPAEAVMARDAGADALVVQGVEAGGPPPPVPAPGPRGTRPLPPLAPPGGDRPPPPPPPPGG